MMANENAITTIKLKTKISPNTGEDKVELSEIPLAQGEPLVNTNDHTLIIGTQSNSTADDSNNIVLGRPRTLTIKSSIDFPWWTGEPSLLSYTNSISADDLSDTAHINDIAYGLVNRYTGGTSETPIGTYFVGILITGPKNAANYYPFKVLYAENLLESRIALSEAVIGETKGVQIRNFEKNFSTSTFIIKGSGATTVSCASTPGGLGYISIDSPDAANEGTLGLVKQDANGHVEINNGVITVKDDSHSHTIANVDDLQTELDGKQATITGAATTITSLDLLPGMALISDSSGKVAASGVTSLELGCLAGASMKIQSQLDAKAMLPAGTNDETEYNIVLGTTTPALMYSSVNAVTVKPSEGKLTAKQFNAYSDARLKENFQPLTPEKSILDLPCYKFDFINGSKNQIGCKAQDLQEICPEIVNEGSDGYLSIQESKIVYLLLEEVKRLRAEVDELKRG